MPPLVRVLRARCCRYYLPRLDMPASTARPTTPFPPVGRHLSDYQRTRYRLLLPRALNFVCYRFDFSYYPPLRFTAFLPAVNS